MRRNIRGVVEFYNSYKHKHSQLGDKIRIHKVEDLIKELNSQLNEKIETLKKLKPEYADFTEKAFKSILEEINSHSYLRRLSELTELNDSLDFSEGTENRP